MDSGNSGSISSSGDEECADLPATLLNHPSHFGSISHPQSHHHPSLFDLSSSYLHSLTQSQPNSNPHSEGQRSEPNCTDPESLPSSSAAAAAINQSLLGPQGLSHDDNARLLSAPPTNNNNNVVRNSKKRTRASRRAPTTVLTTNTTNFRSMVQEFTGIPAPPFSASSSYSRRLDLLAGSSSLRSSGASHLESTMGAFYPLRPSAHKVQPNPLLLSSSSLPLTSRLLHNNMVDAIASTTTNISSSATTNNSSSYNNSFNYQLPHDLGLPYHQPQNTMLSMQNHPILAFHPPPPLVNILPAGFGAKSQASFSIPSLEDLGMSHGQVNNAHLVATTVVSVPPPGHDVHVASESMPLNDDGCRDGSTVGGGRRDRFRSLDGSYGKVGSAGSCKLKFSASASVSLNHEKTLENTSTRGEGNVDSWICSSD